MKRNHVAVAVCLLIVINLFPDTRAQEISHLFELRARYEEFNKLYTQKRREGVNVAAIEPLRQQAETAFKAGNVPGMLEIVSRGIALLEGKQWDERQRFLSSLALKLDRMVLDSNQDLQVLLARMFPTNLDQAFSPAPTVTFEVKPEEPAPAQTGAPVETSVALRGAQPIILGERMAISQGSTIATRRLKLTDGAYWVVARLESGGQTVAAISKPIYAINDFSERVSRLLSLVAVIRNSVDPKVKALAPQVWTPLFHLQRLAELNQTRGQSEINALAEFERIEAILSSLAKGVNPFGKERGEVERALQAADGIVLPYRVYVPQSYDGTTPRPLVVLLSGVLGDERSFFSGLYDPFVIKGESERRGIILAGVPDVSQADAFDVINSVARDYKIDPSRIYLIGHSTGAISTLMIASAKPELFAAIASVSARGSPPPNESVGSLLARAKAIPMLVIHGTKDAIAAIDTSRNLFSTAQKAGLKVEFIDVPEADHFTVVGATFFAVMQFFEKNVKKPVVK